MTTVTVPATTTSPATNAVLVLSTYNAANKPMVVDWDGMLLQITSYNSYVRMQLKIQTVILR